METISAAAARIEADIGSDLGSDFRIGPILS
jgi:hypothetical protein